MTSDLRQYAAVTAAYWGFTLTDGALRMLVLLHFHHLGFTPVELAFLFLLYESMGVVTNLIGGWLGARYGLRHTLFAGLSLQVIALTALSFTGADWAIGLSVAYVMGCQAASGVAKDLTKMSSKSAVKSVVPEGQDSHLFKWVALLTGSKNTLKGVGFFLGGVLLEGFGFKAALWAMAAALFVVLLLSLAVVRGDLGRAKTKVRHTDLLSKNRDINWLSAARVFLFASRDIWFVVGVPVFLYAAMGWSFDAVGGFMAVWVIGYGFVQAASPKILRAVTSRELGTRAALIWIAILLAVTGGLALTMQTVGDAPLAGTLLILGLFVFGTVFAMNSAVHSWLIVAFSDSDKVALNVGFYYMANAWGRLIGTLLSGIVFQLGGLHATLWGACGLVILALIFTIPLATKHLNNPGAAAQ